MSPLRQTLSCLLILLLGCPSFGAEPVGGHRLAQSPSAYLRQHADQLVAWYPWGEEALNRARTENKLIFVSVGYSTCHWCHVMAEDSFANAEVAAALNADFIAIKVDRDERPDLDRHFIAFLEATTGSAGWPASLWLLPDGTPFFATSFVPREDELGSPGFLTLTRRMAALWRDQPSAVREQARLVATAQEGPAATPQEAPDDVVRLWIQAVAEMYDPRLGGFECGPKFPNAVLLSSLLAVRSRGPEAASARDMALFTLRQLARSGLHDVVNGGFHRYAVDAEWHVPHFEKLLSDQALLLEAFTDGWLATQDPEFAAVARSLVRGLDRFRLPAGGLSPALDAGGPAGEGSAYLWTREVRLRIPILDTDEESLTSLGWRAAGNLPSEFPPGANHLDPPDDRPVTTLLEGAGLPLLQRLRAARERGPTPWQDDTRLCAPTSLVAAALARAGAVFDRPDWIAQAEALLSSVRRDHGAGVNGELTRLVSSSSRPTLAFCDDYAATIDAALAVHQATQHAEWLRWALLLQEKQEQIFGRGPDGGYFTEPELNSPLPRRIDFADRAEPSPNGLSAANLLRLASLTGDERYRARARRLFVAAGSTLHAVPAAHPLLVSLQPSLRHPAPHVLVLGDDNDPRSSALLALAQRAPSRLTTYLRITPANQRDLLSLNAELADLLPDNLSTPLALLCANRSCLPPLHSPEALAAALHSSSATTP